MVNRQKILARRSTANKILGLEKLETRLLFSAELPYIVDGLIGINGAVIGGDHAQQSSLLNTTAANNTVAAAELDQAAIQDKVHLVIIDPATPDYESIISDLDRQVDRYEVFVLDANQDGLTQIGQLLELYDNVSAVHLFSHGSDGQVALGNASVGIADLWANADSVAQWQDSFTANADLLIYGCDIAASETGQNFLDTLSQLSGADVAASIDTTGAALSGGNWQLEYSTGSIDTSIAVSAALQDNYQHSLATYTVTTLADTGAGSLRQAIIDANANGGGDTIVFAVSGNIRVQSALPDITDQVSIDATTAPGYSGQPLVALDGASVAGGDGLRLMAGSDGSSISGLLIVHFNGSGIVINSSDNHVVSQNYIGTDGSMPAGNSGYGIDIELSNGNLIGGITQSERNVISGNGLAGIHIYGSAVSNQVYNNYIGTTASGNLAVGNNAGGINIANGASANYIGGNGYGNLISGNNQFGVNIEGPTTTANTVSANIIGTNAAGTVALANLGDGVRVVFSAHNNIIGGNSVNEGNLISGNGGDGIEIGGNGASSNVVLGNLIGTNFSGTAAIGNGSSGVLIHNGAQNNKIGDGVAGSGNIISGNVNGIYIYGVNSTGNSILGNNIGTSSTGAQAIGNTSNGIYVYDSGSNIIGGSLANERNVISGNAGSGIQIRGSVSTNNVIQGNYIGINSAGVAALGNINGILLNLGANNTQIGGKNPGEGNLISGNLIGIGLTDSGTNYNSIYGNYIGTDINGTTAVANSNEGIRIKFGASHNSIGGANAGEANVISANGGDGVELSQSGTQGNVVQGNYIGTSFDGVVALGNGLHGVNIFNGAHSSMIGGTAGQGNIISGNGKSGVHIAGAFGSTTTNNTVAGNLIGTNFNGTSIIANVENGIQIHEGASNNVIGGDRFSGAGNLISGNGLHGIHIQHSGTSGNAIIGNNIGTELSATIALGNTLDGIHIETGATANVVGGAGSGGTNVVSGNHDSGIQIEGPGTNDNIITGNYIGTTGDGLSALGNTKYGVELSNGVQNTIIGSGFSGHKNVISGNGDYGIKLSGVGVNTTENNTISGNFIGTDVSGLASVANASGGMHIVEGAHNNVIGGDKFAGEGNLISGNKWYGLAIRGASFNTVQGNLIGTDVSGSAALGNEIGGVHISTIADSNLIGGDPSAGQGNVISASQWYGITLSNAHNTIVQGNYIGTDSTGLSAMANDRGGVYVSNGSTGNQFIGGNLISGNSGYGISFNGSDTANNSVAGNYIGTDLTGATALGNSLDGVLIYNGAHTNTVGGQTLGDANIISGNGANGIHISGSGTDYNTVQGNYIGITHDGGSALGNAYSGVIIDDQASANQIGGANPGQINIISDNLTGIDIVGAGTNNNSVQGNYIGTDHSGTISLGNVNNGVWIGSGASNNIVGGDQRAGEGNLISGNLEFGVFLSAANNTTVQGNFIGTDYNGTTALQNGLGGVYLGYGATGNLIGGTQFSTGNLISGNNGSGILTDADSGANSISGNLIGLAVDGVTALGNSDDGVRLLSNANVIGGTAVDTSNIISGNNGNGLTLQAGSGNNSVLGNVIGLDQSGTLIVANAKNGVFINSDYNTIGGSAQAERNIISGNGQSGILVAAAIFNTIHGNYVGTDITGMLALGNTDNGVTLEIGSASNQIGGSSAGEGNLISANTVGVLLQDIATTGNFIRGNLIGTNKGGSAGLGNSLHGIQLSSGASANTIGGTATGSRNTIAFNVGAGVSINSASSLGNSILGNLLHSQGGPGINLGIAGVNTNDAGDADSGANNLQNFPVLELAESDASSSTTIDGLISSSANTTIRIEFFSNSSADATGYGEAEVFLGAITVTTDASGQALFSNTIPIATTLGDQVTATATVDLGGGNYGDTSEFAQNIIVVEYNIAPVFTSSADFFPVENTTVAGTITAIDADGDVPQYSLIGSTDDSLFSIDGNSGVLSFNSAPDVEAPADANVDNAYEVTVQVIDGLGGSATQLITVTVQNLDDTAPVITSGQVFSVDEHTTNDTVVGTALAIDVDSAAVQGWNIISGNGAGVFSIDTSTGVISIADASLLNFESLNQYSLTLQVGDGTQTSAMQSVLINVVDSNDAPQITASATMVVSENTTVAGTITAIDADGDVPQYSLIGSTDDSLFSIDGNSGVLSFNSAPDVEAPADANVDNAYEVTVQVIDGLGGSATQLITVTVQNLDDTAPVITSGQVFSVDEHTTNDTVVGTALAIDVDSAAVQGWNIISGNGAGVFSIDTSTGVISIADASLLNFESLNQYSLTLQVGDGTQTSAMQSVLINVVDNNDAPVLNAPSAVVVTESSTNIVLQASANDADNDAVKLSLAGADGSAFIIDNSTGSVQFLSTPDFESPHDVDLDNLYELQLIATDSNGAQTIQALQVQVLNKNEAPAVVTSEFASSEGFTGMLGQINIIDPDNGDEVTLSIIGGSGSGAFEVNSDSGDLVQHTALDAGEYTLDVLIVDSNGGSTRATLTIRIIADDAEGLTDNTTGTDGTSDTGTIGDTTSSGNLSTNPGDSIPELGSAASEADVTDTEYLSPQPVSINSLVGAPIESGAASSNEPPTATASFNEAEFVEDATETLSPSEQSPESPSSALSSNSTKGKVVDGNRNTLFADDHRVHNPNSQLMGTHANQGITLVLELLLEEAEEGIETLGSVFNFGFGAGGLNIAFTPEVLAALQSLRSDVDSQDEQEAAKLELIVQVGTVATVTLTAGFVTWLLQSGALFASALSTSPLWRPLDPVPILAAGATRHQDESSISGK